MPPQKNTVVPIGVEFTPHEQEEVLAKPSRLFYHPLFAIGFLLLFVLSGAGLAFFLLAE